MVRAVFVAKLGKKEFGWSASGGMGEYEQLLMDCRFLGAVIVEGRP